MENKISAVYQIINTVTGDRYVGSSKNVKERWKCHKSPSRWKDNPNIPLYQDFQKYGIENFRFQILAPAMPECLVQVEQEFIEMLKPSYNDKRAKGWNVKRCKDAARKYQQQLCSYNGEELTLRALSLRFYRAGINHPTLEAKKYLIGGNK